MNIENLLNDDKQNGMAQNIFNILLLDTVHCTLYMYVVYCTFYTICTLYTVL